ncbi:unnamed protein product, partial [Soboliphyme baturini]|uniref:ANAPC4_WD40 domain-containing protein n=1 Tax=Soboliphyme baturini TaxID=241478 RepID=A0A183J7H8_9BILA
MDRKEDTIFLSLLNGTLMAVASRGKKDEVVWEIQLNSSAIALALKENVLYAGTTNGVITVIEMIPQDMPFISDRYSVQVVHAPIQFIVLPTNRTIWCAAGQCITVLHSSTLDTIRIIMLTRSVDETIDLAFMPRTTLMTASIHGVWIADKTSSVLDLIDAETYSLKLRFDIAFIMKGVQTNKSERLKITCITQAQKMLWVGTEDGHLLVFRITEETDSATPTCRGNHSCSSLQNFQLLQDHRLLQGPVDCDIRNPVFVHFDSGCSEGNTTVSQEGTLPVEIDATGRLSEWFSSPPEIVLEKCVPDSLTHKEASVMDMRTDLLTDDMESGVSSGLCNLDYDDYVLLYESHRSIFSSGISHNRCGDVPWPIRDVEALTTTPIGRSLSYAGALTELHDDQSSNQPAASFNQ